MEKVKEVIDLTQKSIKEEFKEISQICANLNKVFTESTPQPEIPQSPKEESTPKFILKP